LNSLFEIRVAGEHLERDDISTELVASMALPCPRSMDAQRWVTIGAMHRALGFGPTGAIEPQRAEQIPEIAFGVRKEVAIEASAPGMRLKGSSLFAKHDRLPNLEKSSGESLRLRSSRTMIMSSPQTTLVVLEAV
jgi:hypothetical protein